MAKVDTIQEIVKQARGQGYIVTVFSGRQRMPAALKGIPDLLLMRRGVCIFVEVKMRHANYMRDQMRDAQWEWYHKRRDNFGEFLRYAIVENADELLTWLSVPKNEWVKDSATYYPRDLKEWHAVYIPEYHWERYNKWRRGR